MSVIYVKRPSRKMVAQLSIREYIRIISCINVIFVKRLFYTHIQVKSPMNLIIVRDHSVRVLAQPSIKGFIQEKSLNVCTICEEAFTHNSHFAKLKRLIQEKSFTYVIFVRNHSVRVLALLSRKGLIQMKSLVCVVYVKYLLPQRSHNVIFLFRNLLFFQISFLYLYF